MQTPLLPSKIFMRPFAVLCLFCFLTETSCTQQTPVAAAKPADVQPPAYKSWAVGDTSDVRTKPLGGTVLMGGSTDVDNAMRWLLQRTDGGDVVVLRATGADGYNQYLFDLQKVNSVETFLVNSRELANNAAIERKIRNAEAVFIAGGDQANYINFWKNTKLEDALNYLINTKKVVVGGTSAGCGVLGGVYFAALSGTVRSEEALADPYDGRVVIQKDDFLNNPLLVNVVADMHYDNPDRRGRQLVFMARMAKDFGVAQPRGIGVDEKTAVCVDLTGKALVFGEGNAYFLEASAPPEVCEPQKRLGWVQKRKAVSVCMLPGSANGENTFDLPTWRPAKTTSPQRHWYVEDGVLKEE